MTEADPFEVKCKHCGTVARSWHNTATNVPDDGERGLSYCQCGRTGADSTGVKDRGRVVERRSENKNGELIEAIETMARAVGAHAVCKSKFDRLWIEFPKLPQDAQQAKALYALAGLVEQASMGG